MAWKGVRLLDGMHLGDWHIHEKAFGVVWVLVDLWVSPIIAFPNCCVLSSSAVEQAGGIEIEASNLFLKKEWQ